MAPIRGIEFQANTDNYEAACNVLVEKAILAYGWLDILVVASSMNKVALINP